MLPLFRTRYLSIVFAFLLYNTDNYSSTLPGVSLSLKQFQNIFDSWKIYKMFFYNFVNPKTCMSAIFWELRSTYSMPATGRTLNNNSRFFTQLSSEEMPTSLLLLKLTILGRYKLFCCHFC
jgi:hypothetical protein